MSGHSKWANIKNKKAKTDAAKGKIFTKIGREIAVAAKAGADPSINSKLADVIAKAKAANMPNDNIKRSIQKATGELGNVNYENLIYEGYGVGGSAVIVSTLTENKNRTVGEVRHIFDRYGGSMGNTGSVSFMFENRGVIVIERTVDLSEDEALELALDAGADDVITSDDVYEIRTAPSAFSAVRKYFEEKGYTFVEASIEMVPNDKITLNADQIVTFRKMLDAFEDNDDVQDIYHNVDLPEDEEEE
ncbi:MAG: YebC/PmpR family DNA-binding transcriptional regulator [Candidatus Borkfalkiaceae bacterium]|nr:YebC/PmpR family DNA-binding transcriptional regulator [Christensenellaceae bacterium]